MSDLVVGAGLVLVFEGLIWAISPAFAVRLLVVAAQVPERRLRIGGAIAVAAGVLLVGIVRG